MPIRPKITILFAGFSLLLSGNVSAEDLLLAVTWQPAFCETRPKLKECASQTADRFDASHFSLHGLWPQPRGNFYCGVSRAIQTMDRPGNWLALPKLDLASETRAALKHVMPGMRSGLHRHEWIKHGTCYGNRTAEVYYRDFLSLLEDINRSAVRDLFFSVIGKRLTGAEVRYAFDNAFGSGAGERVSIHCKEVHGRTLIVELRIALKGPVKRKPVKELIADASPVRPGCSKGYVDEVS